MTYPKVVSEVPEPPADLFALVASQVERTPSAIAVRFRDEAITYAELAARSRAVAATLRSRGVGPGSLVAVYCERSIELVVGLLAILEAGAAYVPVDPGYPSTRIAYMFEDADASVTLTQSHLLNSLPDGAGWVIVLDAEGPSGTATQTSRHPATPSDLAYVIYTSGSTGRPKGVMNTHAGISNRLLWMQDRFHLTAADRVLQKTPYSFDVSVWEFFWPLMTGAQLVVAEPDGHVDPSYLVDVIEREGVSVLHFVPSMLHLFLETERLAERCASIRLVICSGEALSQSLVDDFYRILGSTEAQLFNLYGPTEAAVDVTWWRCEPGVDGPVPIGHPVANTQIHLLDSQMRPVEQGSEGELYIGGVQVARGYLNRPELTAERFVPDPFSEEVDARLYRTGDLARRREDGAVEFLGRTDHQVKVRGFRIELGEIEATITAHPDISQALVVARQDGGGLHVRLVAYVVPRQGGQSPSVSDLRRFAASRLPEYMLPAAFVPLDSLPLMPNGKVDRSSLPDSERERPALEQPFVGPKNAFQKHVAERWARILNLDSVGIKDRFFELGGDSLQAARFVQAMREELGEFIYVTTIYEAPSVEEYTDLLAREYPDAVRGRFPEAVSAAGSRTTAGQRIGSEELRAFRGIVPRWALDRPSADAEGPNPRAVFIVSPPRSGTTLLRVMLAGHPDLFAASELQLLGFHSLAERERAYVGKYALWLEGTVRALMELHRCDADEAKARMAEHVTEGRSTKAFYRHLQSLVGDRILVDKSPSYALDIGALRKAERDFEDPFYIHLVRHPYSVTRSFERYHMDQVLYLEPHDFSSRQLGELVWLESHRTALEFLSDVPAGRQFRIRYEELVTDPEEVMRPLSESLGIPYHEVLVEPYADLEGKMTDGLYADSTPMGDTKLLERRRIDPARAEEWKGVEEDDFLGELTWETAVRLGYSPVGDPASRGASRRHRRHAAAGLRSRRDRDVGGRG